MESIVVSKVAHDSGIRDGSSLSNFFKREVNSKIVMDVHTSYQSSTSNSHRKRDGFFSQDSRGEGAHSAFISKKEEFTFDGTQMRTIRLSKLVVPRPVDYVFLVRESEC